MPDHVEVYESLAPEADNSSVSRRLKRAVTVVLVAMVVAITWVGVTSRATYKSSATPTTISTPPQYSAGVVDASEASGLAPMSPTAVPGFVQSYVNNFAGSSLPPGWFAFSGIPGGDPTGQFDPQHVVVNNGLLELNAWRDPKYKNMWVTGGLCLCGHPQTYGAFFARSRQTGSGPNEVQLLWPKDNSWPPEIDFTETGGASFETSATVHWTIANHLIQTVLRVDLSQWHTWGVIWTPQSIQFTLDGRVWASDTNIESIPNQPMTMDFEQRTVCDPLTQCPKRPTSLLINWVAMYSLAKN
jgi:Glycosyl hydrolases family 16